MCEVPIDTGDVVDYIKDMQETIDQLSRPRFVDVRVGMYDTRTGDQLISQAIILPEGERWMVDLPPVSADGTYAIYIQA